MVPCSRSRTIAAPARMIASMEMLLMMPMTLVNHAVVMLGLNAIRTARLTGDRGAPSEWETKSEISVVTICCAYPDPRPAWTIAVASTSI